MSLFGGEELFRLLNLDPDEEGDRLKYDDDAVIEAVRRDPNAAARKYEFAVYDGYEFYPLVMVVSLGGSLNAVRLMYEACPEVVENTTRQRYTRRRSLGQAHPNQARNGWTPLHFACRYKASFKVMQFLADGYHLAIEGKNNLGCTPLHLACINGVTSEVAWMLVERCPSSIGIKDLRQRTALMYAETVDAHLDVISLLTTLHTLLCRRPSNAEVLLMLMEWRGEMWSSQVAPILHWRSSVVHGMDVSPVLMPSLLARVGREGRVQTVFQIIRETMDLCEHAGTVH